MLEGLTAGDFRPHVGATFRLTAADGAAFDSVLVEVEELPAHASAPRPPFTLLFRAPPATAAAQGTFRVERDGAEALELFLVPVGPEPGGDGMRYEAVFA